MKADWIETTLDDIAKWGSGGTPKSTIPEYYDGDIPWLIIGDLNDSYVSTSEKKITELGLKNSSAKWVKADSVLIAMYGSIGKLGINKIPVTTNQAIAFTQTLYGDIQNKFLFYYLLLCRPKLHKVGKGGTQKNISQTVLKTIDFPLAPLLEQKVIVAKIEQLFSELDNGVANLKTAKAKLKIYRQAVLKKAFGGELTKEWREKQNKQQIKKWSELELKEIVISVTQGWSPRCLNEPSSNHEEWAVIKTSAIQHNAFLEYENKILPTNLEPRIQHELKEGDILVTRAGPRNRVGVCCLIENIRPKLINCDKVYRIRLNNEKILNKFFILNINSYEYIQKIDFIKTGGNDSGLNLTQERFLSLELSVPPLEEQNQIVQEIESRLSVCDKIEETIETSLAKSEALRQSILKKAFEGKLLGEQELENIKNHPEYESADKLLERIKKERAK